MQEPNKSNSTIINQKMSKSMDINTETVKKMTNLDKILSLSLQNHPLSYDKIAECLQRNHTIDYINVIEVMKKLKSIDPYQQKQLESILSSKTDTISNNAIKEIIGNLKSDNNRILTANIPYNDNQFTNIGTKSSNDNKSNEYLISEDILSGDDSDADSLSIKSLILRKEGTNLIDNVKENIDHILQANLIKKKNTRKKWWTGEEVHPLIFLFLSI